MRKPREIKYSKKAGHNIPAFFIVSKREDQLFLMCVLILILQALLQIEEGIVGPIVLTALLYSLCVIITKFISEACFGLCMLITIRKNFLHYIFFFLYTLVAIGMTALVIFYGLEGFTPYTTYGIEYLKIEKQDYFFMGIFILFLSLYPFARKEKESRKH